MPAVSRSITLDAAPEEVWDAITDEARLREWLAPDVALEAREGGEIECRYEDGEVRRGEVSLVEEAERLAFTWTRDGRGESRVELIVDAVADGVRLTVVETAASPLGPQAGAGWSLSLEGLRRCLASLVYA
jgi:uncharacterized protein YndB with AHSA1/START domain